MNASPTPESPPPNAETDRTDFRLKNPLNVGGRQLARGDVVVTIERPRGITVGDALAAIRCGEAVDRRIF